MKHKYIPFGNEYVSLPMLDQATGAIENLTFLHMGAKGLIEMCGTDKYPLMEPWLEVDGEKLTCLDLAWNRVGDWLPEAVGKTKDFQIHLSYVTPPEERGFALKINLKNEGNQTKTVTWGLKGCWAKSLHTVNESKPIYGKRVCYESHWNDNLVFEQYVGLPLFACAVMTEKKTEPDFKWEGDLLFWSTKETDTVGAGEEAENIWYWGVGPEEVAAATSAKEMLRQGFNELELSNQAQHL